MKRVLGFMFLVLGSQLLLAHQNKKNSIKSIRQTTDSFSNQKKKDISVVDKFENIFTEAKLSTQLRMMYAGYDYDFHDPQHIFVDNYATALGGIIKYELASLNGFNGAIALSTSQNVDIASGKQNYYNTELSSSRGYYNVLSEAYLNYKYETLNIRLGRQLIDTPLADSDDVRMIQNSFEAYLLSYEFSDIKFLGGNLQKWQGTGSPLGLEDHWQSVGDDGTWLAGLTYDKDLELSAWFYDISGFTQATYLEGAYSYKSNGLHLHGALQYLHEGELQASSISADIYGVYLEAEMDGFGVSLGHNHAVKKQNHKSFAGVGGGALYTSMDTMTLDTLSLDRGVDAYVVSVNYTYKRLSGLYGYGDFSGGANSSGKVEHVSEQNLGLEYKVKGEFVLGALFVIDKELQSDAKTEYDFTRGQLTLKYDF